MVDRLHLGGAAEKAYEDEISRQEKPAPSSDTTQNEIPSLEERKARAEEQVRKSPAPGESGFTPSGVGADMPQGDSRGFTPNPDWEIVNRDSGGNVTEYKDRSGVRYFTPFSSNWQAGFKTSEDIRKAQEKAGLIVDGQVTEGAWASEAPNVATETAQGEPIHLSRVEAQKLASLPPEERFSEMQLQGLLPKDAQFAGEKDGRITYYTSEALKQQQEFNLSDVEARQSRAQFGVYQQSVNEWLENQVERGLAKDTAEAEQQLAEVQSGKYLAYMPDLDNPEDVSKGSFVPVWAGYVAERQKSGLSPQELGEVYSGKYVVTDPVSGEKVATTKQSYLDITARKVAEDTLKSAGFTEGEIPKSYIQPAGSPQLRQFTIPNMAEYARRNPDGMKTLKDYGFQDDTINQIKEYNTRLSKSILEVDKLLSNGDERYGGKELALDLAMENAGFKEVLNAHAQLSGMQGGLWVDDKTGEVLTNKELVERKWLALTDAQKEIVAPIWASDYYKGSYIAEISKGMSDIASKSGAIGMVAYSPILPVTQPIAKQLTLDEAKKELATTYKNELTTLSSYVKQNGTFDVAKLEDDIKKDSNLSSSLLEKTGYKTVNDLKNNLEFYNYSTTVTPKEWAIAGLVAALDVIVLSGGEALASLGIAGNALERIIPTSLATISYPDVVKTVRNPSIGNAEKALAVLGEIGMIAPTVTGAMVRGTQFAYLASRGDYVPLRSLSREAQTSRVPFTEAQITKMRNAGVTESDIINAGTKINEQLVAGNKKAVVKLGGVTITVKNVPYQSDVGLSLFNSTPDITRVDRGGSVPLIKKFYTAAKVAIEPLERSYLEGQRATAPGIIEIRIADPEIIGKIAPQQKLITGGKVLEPEMVLPSIEELQGMGYRLEPIAGRAGRGVTFDANLGRIAIRRFTLSKVTDNPTGLINIKLGKSGNGGTTAVGDLHGTSNSRTVFNDINSSFAEPVIKGNPDKPSTWHWVESVNKDRTVVVLGDSIDRGNAYQLWRKTFNRLHDEAKTSGDNVVRLIGNHELAYLSDDAISGIKYTDKTRAIIKSGLKEDFQSGKVKVAHANDGKLFTHAGVSLGAFDEFKPQKLSAKYIKLRNAKNKVEYNRAYSEAIADNLNERMMTALKKSDYSDKMFAKGRVEKGHSLSFNEREQGGIFWLRPQEALAAELDLGITQVVGHNPGFAVRRIWGDNFIEADVGRRSGGTGVYADTPYVATKPAEILTRPVGGESPQLGRIVMTKLKLKAMRDTVADVFLGWDGRIYAVEKIKASKEAVAKTVERINKEIDERKLAGDSIGVKYLERQRDELIMPTGRDYIYGGIGFWRDIVMGRQNSVKVLTDITKTPKSNLITTLGTIGQVRNQITQMSDKDVSRLFGYSKQDVMNMLDTSTINRADIDASRNLVYEKARNLVDIVDSGLDRSIASLLDSDTVYRNYATRLDSELRDIYSNERAYDAIPERGFEGEYYESDTRYADYGARTSEGREVSQTRESEMSLAPEERTMIAPRIPDIERPVEEIYVKEPPRVAETRLPDIRTPEIRSPDVQPPRIEPPRIEPPRIPPTPTRGIVTPAPMSTSVTRLQTHSPTTQPVPEGSVAFAMGERKGVRGAIVPQWYFIPPPYNQSKPVSMSAPPLGAVRIDSNNPYETIQVIGRSRTSIVPETIALDMGISDVIISNYGQQIAFRSKGESTDVGTSLPSTTVGMSVPQEGLTQGINRTKFSKKAPKRKTKRSGEFDDIISMKGVRL